MKLNRQNDVLVSIAGLVITLAAAFGVMFIMIFIMSEAPGPTIKFFFAGPLTNRYYLGNMFNSAIPLVLTGLGISFAFRSSMFNLGGKDRSMPGD